MSEKIEPFKPSSGATMRNTKLPYFLKLKDGTYRKILGTQCTELECREYGCCFPDCAELDDQVIKCDGLIITDNVVVE